MWQSGMMAPIKTEKTVMASAQRVTGRRQVALAEAQNRGDQRAGVADADPENEIGDVEGPEHRRVDAPHADAGIELVAKRSHAREQQAGRKRHGDPVLAAAVEERPQQILLDLFSRSLHLARCLVRDKSRWAWCPVRPAVWCRDCELASRETSLLGSFRSPKTRALDAQDCAQAVVNSPSFSSRFSASAWISAALMRCTQKVHFSMMPTLRTETSGLSCRLQRLVPVRIVEIEEAHVVGAGIGAKARADAAVVDLRVQPFGRVIAGVGGADRLAGRLVALLAQHRLKADARVGEIALPVALDANPVLGAAARGLVLARGGDIVFRMARDHARFAARAAVQIHHHVPTCEPYNLRLSSAHAERSSMQKLARFFFVREAAHSSREQYQLGLLGSAHARELHPRRGPGQRSGFAFGERRKNRERVRAAAAGKPAEILMSLAHRHGHHIGSDARGKNRRQRARFPAATRSPPDRLAGCPSARRSWD